MNKYIKALLLTAPAILILIVAIIFTSGLYNNLTINTPIISMLISSDGSNKSDTLNSGEELILPETLEFPDSIEYTDKEFPVINFDTQWATLNVDGWKTTDIPVYFGDTKDQLAKGAGQWIGSYFCGLGKSCILSANVLTWFYEIEDTQIGTEVIMQTIYGNYKYEVTDKFVLSNDDTDILYEELGEDTLILHTSYPRSKSLGSSGQRIVLVCSLKNGLLYKNMYETN